MVTYFSENPEIDLWRELLQFTYEANIQRYANKKGLVLDAVTTDCIIGSFLQAYEYYKAAKESNLQISPLLLYYGSTNLLYGMSNLLSGKINKIENHGMWVSATGETKFIADTTIRFCNPTNGGVHVFAKAIDFNSNMTDLGEWKLREFLDSIAEIHKEYETCYELPCSKILMLETVNTPDGQIEKVHFDSNNQKEIYQLLQSVPGFSKSYLPPVTSSNSDFYILRHKLNGKRICEISYSGQPYLRSAHIKNGQDVTVPTILNMYISLFTLSSLCRYQPEVWSPFVMKDNTGEKLLVEKFLFFSRRMIPNIVLNFILENDIQYTSAKYKATDIKKLVDEDQVRSMITKEVKNVFNDKWMGSIGL